MHVLFTRMLLERSTSDGTASLVIDIRFLPATLRRQSVHPTRYVAPSCRRLALRLAAGFGKIILLRLAKGSSTVMCSTAAIEYLRE
jgi:hypothetical protein